MHRRLPLPAMTTSPTRCSLSSSIAEFNSGSPLTDSPDFQVNTPVR